MVIGSLLYLTLGTRPDITFAVTKLAQYAARPTKEHLQKALNICRYLVGTVRNFLFLICPTRTRTSRLPQTMPQTTTTSHINHTQGNYRLPHHPDHHIPFPNHQSLRPTNPPSLRHQRTQPPIPKRIHPYPTGTHDPRHSDLGHLGHTGPGPFGT